MRYSGVNLDAFIPLLKTAMKSRIEKFEKYMRKKYSDDVIRSKKQWAEEFKRWSIAHRELEAEILKYLNS